jgi:ankyrin repeat protein
MTDNHEDESGDSEDESGEDDSSEYEWMSQDSGCDNSDEQHCDMEDCPLWVASADGDVVTVRELLRVGVDLEKGYGGTTPLLKAVKEGSWGLSHLKQSDPLLQTLREEEPPRYEEEMRHAIERRRQYGEIVDMLLRAGADSNFVSKDDTTCLTEAGDLRIVQLLLENSSNPRDFASRKLHDAAIHNEVDIALMLLKHGADVNFSAHGKTALFNANSEMTKLLIDHGADVTHRDIRGHTAIHWHTFHENTEVIQQLIDGGIGINDRDGDGNTLLHNVAMSGNVTMAKFLVTKPVCFNIKSSCGETPCECAERVERERENKAPKGTAKKETKYAQILAVFQAEILRRARDEAFLMGYNPRLGAASRVLTLNPDVLRMVLDRL